MPESISKKIPNLSPEARKVFKNTVSGPYGERHSWSREHAAYNEAVREILAKRKFKPSEMTKKEAEDFVELIKRSNDPRIEPFVDAIIDKRLRYEQLLERNDQ
jgi:hypothetical protein